MRLLYAPLALAPLFLSANQVSAPARRVATISHVVSVPVSDSTAYFYSAIPPFDPQLGWLIRVSVDAQLTGTVAAVGENCDPVNGGDVTLGNGPLPGEVGLYWQIPLGGQWQGPPQATATTPLPPLAVEGVAPFDGVLDFEGPSAWSIGPMLVAGSQFFPSFASGTITTYQYGYPVGVRVGRILTATIESESGCTQSTSSVAVGGSLRFTYHYLPN